MAILNPAKVYKLFGNNPERGKPLSFLPKEEVVTGMRWSNFAKSYKPYKELVSPCVALRQLKGNLYEVKVKKNCRYSVEHWLLQNCS